MCLLLVLWPPLIPPERHDTGAAREPLSKYLSDNHGLIAPDWKTAHEKSIENEANGDGSEADEGSSQRNAAEREEGGSVQAQSGHLQRRGSNGLAGQRRTRREEHLKLGKKPFVARNRLEAFTDGVFGIVGKLPP